MRRACYLAELEAAGAGALPLATVATDLATAGTATAAMPSPPSPPPFPANEPTPLQFGLFAASDQAIVTALRGIDPDAMSPRVAPRCCTTCAALEPCTVIDISGEFRFEVAWDPARCSGVGAWERLGCRSTAGCSRSGRLAGGVSAALRRDLIATRSALALRKGENGNDGQVEFAERAAPDRDGVVPVVGAHDGRGWGLGAEG